MKIEAVQFKTSWKEHQEILQKAEKLQILINLLNERNLPEEVKEEVNKKIEFINEWDGPETSISKKLDQTQSAILKILLKKMGITTPGYFKSLWLSVGMAALGLPLGVAVFVATGNAAFIGIGLPVGMVIGITVGAALDSKTEKQGNILRF